MTILASLACTVDSSGIARPLYADIYETLQARFQGIYGSDAYIDPDSKDGQLLAVFAKAIDDSNALAVAVYNSYSPATAVGQALSNTVKINGITRGIATRSTAVVNIGGQVGATIVGGVVGDTAGNKWDLPGHVTIPLAGVTPVTVTAQELGNVIAPAGTINQIMNPQLGWQTVVSIADAVPGAPVESDAMLRRRQTTSVALPSQTVLAGILGAVQTLEGVSEAVIYENDTDVPDSNGLPGHSIALVVIGGVPATIAQTIANKKTPGCYTYGTTAVEVLDPNGIHYTIRYFIPALAQLLVEVTIKALVGYNPDVGVAIQNHIADYINSLKIGQKVDLGKLYLPAQFYGGLGSTTFEVDGLALGRVGNVPTANDALIDFNEVAQINVSDVTIFVEP